VSNSSIPGTDLNDFSDSAEDFDVGNEHENRTRNGPQRLYQTQNFEHPIYNQQSISIRKHKGGGSTSPLAMPFCCMGKTKLSNGGTEVQNPQR
jgi:hypothetical protein